MNIKKCIAIFESVYFNNNFFEEEFLIKITEVSIETDYIKTVQELYNDKVKELYIFHQNEKTGIFPRKRKYTDGEAMEIAKEETKIWFETKLTFVHTEKITLD